MISNKDDVLRRGEFLMAYRNFIKEHRADQLKRIKQDAWTRAARLFNLPQQRDALYGCVDPYRRGYFMAKDLPAIELDEMLDKALGDLVALDQEANATQTSKSQKNSMLSLAEPALEQDMSVADIEDYLTRNLEIWDSQTQTSIQPMQFADVLKRYSDPKRQHIQCCYCGSPLRGEEWMSIQVPANVSVQSFSNRLEAGSLSDPKRNVCSVCRTQFILEKLAWRTHGDKRGSEQTTFYLHLFPYSFFPHLLLDAWWQSIKGLRDADHSAFFIRTNQFFDSWHESYQEFHVPISRSKLDGVSISAYSEAMSNTPVLPLIMGGKNYSEQLIRVLENTVILALWFDCRILLSRLPTPILNLSNEKLGDGKDAEPVALLVESVPTQLSWLLPHSSLSRHDVDGLRRKLAVLHQVARKLTSGGDDPIAVVYDLVTAASTDELSLYFEVDRLIERAVSQRKVSNPEHFAINLTHEVAQLLAQLPLTNEPQTTSIGETK